MALLSEAYLRRFAKIAGFKLNEEKLDPKIPEGVQGLADYAARHDVDYGVVYYNQEKHLLFLNMSDSGGQDEETGEDYEKVFVRKAIDAGFTEEEIEIESECGMDTTDGWVEVKTKEKYQGD